MFLKKKKSQLHKNLSCFRAYERAIERIVEGRELFYSIGKESDSIHKGILIADPRSLAKKLAKSVELNEHRVRPATPKLVPIGDKLRTFYAFAMEDRIIQNVIGEVLYDLMIPGLSSKLYSYRKGVSWWDAEISLARYLSKHNRQFRNRPKERGLYVFGHDFSNYTDAIPVGEGAPIWDMLKKVFKLDQYDPMPEHFWSLVVQSVRPEIVERNKIPYSNILGIPMGSPVCQQLGNLYATALDEKLESIPDAFYARYNDDFVFAHPNVNVARKAREAMSEVLKPLGVRLNMPKAQEIFLNPAGVTSEAWPELRGANSINYLGYTLSAKGLIRLNKKKHRRFLREIRSRARSMLRFLKKQNHAECGKSLCRALSEALDPLSLSPLSDAKAVLTVVNDLKHLKELDLDIARILAEEITGKKGPKVFREISYKQMRSEWGLRSLYYERHNAA